MLLSIYLEQLKQFCGLQKKLHDVIEKHVVLVTQNEHGFDFTPTETSILKQIKNWPTEKFILPPVAWVQPRKGEIELGNERWDFAFHGTTLSFINTKKHYEVSIEYSRNGDISVTRYLVLTYLESLPKNASYIHDIINQHPIFFDELVISGQLIEVPSLLSHDDQTYILR